MLGMPLDAWVLLFIGVGLGLTLEVTFFRARWRARNADDDGVDKGGPE